MKKLLLIILSVVFIAFNSYSQDNFRRDYTYVSIYQDGVWSESNEGDNTFVFNANERNDIIHYTNSGKKYLYRKLSGIEEGYTEDDNRYKYQLVMVLDDDGNEIILQLFDDDDIGLKLILSEDLMIQFHN